MPSVCAQKLSNADNCALSKCKFSKFWWLGPEFFQCFLAFFYLTYPPVPWPCSNVEPPPVTSRSLSLSPAEVNNRHDIYIQQIGCDRETFCPSRSRTKSLVCHLTLLVQRKSHNNHESSALYESKGNSSVKGVDTHRQTKNNLFLIHMIRSITYQSSQGTLT